MVGSGTKRIILGWLPVIAYCILIYVQSSHSAPKRLPSFSGLDKLLHFCGYGLLGLLMLRAFRISDWRLGAGKLIGYSILLTGLYGISDEIHQAFVTVRHADVLDCIADALGGTCGVLLYFFLNRGAPVFNGGVSAPGKTNEPARK